MIDGLRRARELSGATVIVATHDAITAAAFPRTLSISYGAVGSEGRGGRRFAVVGRDGAVHLPLEVTALYPAGSLFRVIVTDTGVELRPEPRAEDELGTEPDGEPSGGNRSESAGDQ